METELKKYHYTLIDFQSEVMGNEDYEYKQVEAAIARGGKLLWETEHCARVLIRSNWGFHITLDWGIKEDN